MTARDDIVAHQSVSGRGARRRSMRFAAATLAVGLTAGVIVSVGGGTAEAAAGIRAQSVGRFIDGTVGGMPIQSVADLKDARAKAAPDTSVRNPLTASLLGQLDAPLGDSLKLPGGGVFSLGAANQLAVANTDGYSYGAAGAVSNTGGADLTDDQGAYPSDAKIDLSTDLLGSVPIPGLDSIPGLPTLPGTLGSADDTPVAALGGISADIGAIQALAQTKSGGEIVAPQSKVATVQVKIGSPALGALLAQLKALFSTSVLDGIITGAASGETLPVPLPTTLPSDCALTNPVASDISLDDGAAVLDTTNATITIDVGKLLKTALGEDIANLSTSNFDLTTFLIEQLPTILSNGLETLVTGITDPLKTAFTDCLAALPAGLGALLSPLLMAIDGGETTLVAAVNQVTAPLVSASSAPLAALASGLESVIDIGLNVQDGPKVQQPDPDYPFESDLAATPDQATSVVNGQSLVRAIEIDLLDTSALPTAPGLPGGLGQLPAGSLPGPSASNARQLAGASHAAAHYAVAPGDGAAVLALGNAAAGPSTAAVATPTPSTPATSVPSTSIPTGVPAGDAAHRGGGSPLLPIALLLLGLTVAGGGVTSYRLRGRHGR